MCRSKYSMFGMAFAQVIRVRECFCFCLFGGNFDPITRFALAMAHLKASLKREDIDACFSQVFINLCSGRL